MSTKSSSYRFTQTTGERIDKLHERFGQSRTKVIEDAIFNLALQEGVLDEEAQEAIDELGARHGNDPVVTFAIVENTTNVPVAIDGKPTRKIRAHRLLSYAYFVEQGPPAMDPNAEHTVIALIPNTGITFELGRHEAPKKIEMRLSELSGLRKPFQPRSAFGQQFNREVRRTAGIEPEDDEEL